MKRKKSKQKQNKQKQKIVMKEGGREGRGRRGGIVKTMDKEKKQTQCTPGLTCGVFNP
jgi:hypothetical protein